MFRRYVNCPLCFSRIKISDIGFKCEAPSCQRNEAFFRTKKEISIWERLGLVRPPHRFECKSCHGMATARICPRCKREIPTDVDDLSDVSIAIIGAKESGKSHYIAMLIQWIKKMGNEFGWNLVELNEETIRRYKREFLDPLFRRHQAIQATPRAAGNNQVSPLIYSLNIGKGLFARKLMLVFFDAAGENLTDEDSLRYINRYIYNAKGIICLLDPLQLLDVRRALAAQFGEESLPQQNGETGEIINRVWRMIRENIDTSKQVLSIPLAVAFSKMDFVREADDDAAHVCQELFRETRHRGGFCEAEFQNIDNLMRSWAARVCGIDDIVQQSKNFKTTAFFGFSALGCNPKSRGETLEHDPRSYRIEDPFLWLLNKRGLIKQIKG